MVRKASFSTSRPWELDRELSVNLRNWVVFVNGEELRQQKLPSA